MKESIIFLLTLKRCKKNWSLFKLSDNSKHYKIVVFVVLFVCRKCRSSHYRGELKIIHKVTYLFGIVMNEPYTRQTVIDIVKESEKALAGFD